MRVSSTILLLTMLLACEPTDKADPTTSPSATAKPAVQVVARNIELHNELPRHGGGEDDVYTPTQGHIFAVVTAAVAHSECADGDKLDIKHAQLVLADKKVEAIGGSVRMETVCVHCDASEPARCGKPQTFIFVFEVPESAEVAKGSMSYRNESASFSKVTVDDKRVGPDDPELAAKKAELKRLKKKLENVTSKSAGRLLLAQIEELKVEIAALENKSN